VKYIRRVDNKKHYTIIIFVISFREKAIDKAKAMIHQIAYPDELLDDRKLIAFYENVINSIGPDYSA